MHSYLPAIGLRQIKKKSQFQKLLKAIVASPDHMTIIPGEDGYSYTVLMKEVEDGIGLAVCGETDENQNFEMEYYFPYITSRTCSTNAECIIKKQSEKESYNGSCDDIRLGLNLIFYINNFIEYKKYASIRKKWPVTKGMCLSALSITGKVLFPIQKTKKQIEALRKDLKQCNKLIEAAREGSQNAAEDLAIRDMNLYSQANRKIQSQDIYAVVDTFFMPCGMECDQYTIMGYITSCNKINSRLTGEELYVMEVLCNDIPIRVCIAKEDLLGVPKAGYRFKGEIWLQGTGMIDSE